MAVHPGMVRTNLFGHRQVLGSIIDFIGRFVMQDPAHGARTTLFAATQDIPGGSFVQPRRLRAHARASGHLDRRSLGLRRRRGGWPVGAFGPADWDGITPAPVESRRPSGGASSFPTHERAGCHLRHGSADRAPARATTPPKPTAAIASTPSAPVPRAARGLEYVASPMRPSKSILAMDWLRTTRYDPTRGAGAESVEQQVHQQKRRRVVEGRRCAR